MKQDENEPKSHRWNENSNILIERWDLESKWEDGKNKHKMRFRYIKMTFKKKARLSPLESIHYFRLNTARGDIDFITRFMNFLVLFIWNQQ